MVDQQESENETFFYIHFASDLIFLTSNISDKTTQQYPTMSPGR